MQVLGILSRRFFPLRTWAHALGARNDARGCALHTGSQRSLEVVEKTEEETEVEPGDAQKRSTFSIFPPVPDQESSLTWGGKKYEEIPIAHIKATYNNTHIQVVSSRNEPFARTSCGTEGFKNAKKATGIAAQTAGIAAAVSAIKGLTMGGLEVISITDNTPIPHNGCRPKKARRL
ncbi:28S ribosomal protein S11, mitochondrial isoform X3 [Monodelphis domestica]|uniref:28S ribosomal protein S11, mitochondrial isoform X3 n=1 Tax=Monodelphis domestica TaxID=13616 RepID=UPI0004434A75|nr:28S ribosomal protein S11, mitochondrial isoform X3 [Monodelphis domestica]